MQILRHLESQLKYIVRDRTSISQRTSYNKGYLGGAAFYSSVKYHRPFVYHFSFNHKRISDCKSCNCWSIFVLLSSGSFLILSSFLFPFFFFFFNFAFNFFPSVACFCLKERLSNYIQTIIWDICRQDRCPIWYLERNQASPGTRTVENGKETRREREKKTYIKHVYNEFESRSS